MKKGMVFALGCMVGVFGYATKIVRASNRNGVIFENELIEVRPCFQIDTCGRYLAVVSSKYVPCEES